MCNAHEKIICGLIQNQYLLPRLERRFLLLFRRFGGGFICDLGAVIAATGLCPLAEPVATEFRHLDTAPVLRELP